MRLTGKVCVVTGAAQGIGHAIASRFASEGGIVVLADVDEETGKASAVEISRRGLAATFAHVDVTTEASVEALVSAVAAEFGRIDVLVNNAGADVFVDPLEATEADWDRCFDLDLKSVWLCSKHAGRVMRDHGGGSIVNVGSIHAFQTSRGSFPYAAAKAGVVGLTRVLALDLAEHNIRVNVLCPGWTATAHVQEWLNDPELGPSRSVIVARHPLGRIGQPDDMTGAAVYFASDDSGFTTGSSLIVDGGLLSRFD